MKSAALFFSFCAVQHAATAAIQPQGIAPAGTEDLHTVLPLRTRRIMAERRRDIPPKSNPGDPAKLSYMDPPKSKVNNIQVSPSVLYPGAQYKKIRYGPYRIPPISEDNAEFRVMNVSGIANLLTLNATKPCEKECVLHGLTTDLEYDDGRLATQKTGSWLHHVVLWNVGPEVNDAVCRSGKIDLGAGMGGLTELEPGYGVEHLFESGNEKTYVDFSVKESPIKLGYHLRTTDELLFNIELMNMEDREKWVWLTLNWDYREEVNDQYKEGHVVWMSIGPDRCGTNSPNPFGTTNLTISQQPLHPKFTEYSVPWVAPADGHVMGGNGHLHEGGTSTSIYKNGQLLCTSYPHYAKSAPGENQGMGMGHGRKRQIMGAHGENNTMIEHIEKQGGCVFPNGHDIKKGDIMFIKADYDFSKHNGMKNKKGEIDEVMAIVGTLVAFDSPLRINKLTQEALR
ncbi:hypothetical protein EJ08DRAFT_697973 [Tothia fuscella]|uniref:Uncharacterized protein n=1 Tax=Tothia fuscella TaxID=1048955 RepID=A0A9P4NR12_9PEZI|nr:hypothetical protein EJ08DRAFT_697973 [Tothia fuscella]